MILTVTHFLVKLLSWRSSVVCWGHLHRPGSASFPCSFSQELSLVILRLITKYVRSSFSKENIKNYSKNKTESRLLGVPLQFLYFYLFILGEVKAAVITPLSLTLQLCNSALSLYRQIHKQAPPLEDIAEDCSPAMRSFLERALERNPALRSSASELLKDEAINPAREDQPRCWSLDSALEEVTHTMLRQQSQHHDTTQGKTVYYWPKT